MIRAATAEDVKSLYGGALDVPADLLVIEDNGVKAIGGVVWIDGQAVGTCKVLPGCSKKELLRAARAVCAAGPLIARRDRTIAGADRFLRWLGFVPVDGVTYERLG